MLGLNWFSEMLFSYSPVDSFDVSHAVVQGLAVVRGRLALSYFWLLRDILNGRLFVNADRGMLMFGGHVVTLL